MRRQNPLTQLLLALLAVILLGIGAKITGIGKETYGLAVGAFFQYGGIFVFLGSLALIVWVIYKKTKI